MIKIINDILDYTKISKNKMLIEQREFNFRSFINNIVNIYKTRIDEKGLKLLINISEDIPEIVVGDELRLAQILNNLLSNAVKFTIQGQIALEVAKISETQQYIEVFIMIIDTGIGIDKEDKDKLFQSFSQVDGSITRRFGGTGLGLSISKRLIEAMNGVITFDSEKNKGSTFSFSIPLGLPGKQLEKKDNIGSAINQTDDQPCINTGKQLFGAEYPMNDMAIYLENKVKSMDEITTMIDKLTMCIEMESWENAEQLASYVKQGMPQNDELANKNVFRLLLAVRKENKEASLAIIEELKALLRKKG